MDIPALALAYRAALLQGGSTVQHARKQAYTVLRAGEAPGAFLEANRHRWTAATLTDTRTRLACFGVWLASQPEGASHAEPWRTLPRLQAGRVALDRASFTAEEVGRLLASLRVPAHRRAFYRCIGTLGLRPVEASRIEAQHIVQQNGGFALRLPGSMQKSGREDVLTLSKAEADEIRANLPLLRQELGHYGETFILDLARAQIPHKQDGVARRLYDLRASYISELLRQGVDLATVQQLARHRNIEVTLKYYARHQHGQAGDIRCKVFASMRPKKVKEAV